MSILKINNKKVRLLIAVSIFVYFSADLTNKFILFLRCRTFHLHLVKFV